MRLIFILLLAFSSLAGQNKSVSYISSEVHSGLPQEIPVKWKNCSYAKISSGEFYKSLYIVSKDSFKTVNEVLLFVIKKDGFSFTELLFDTDETEVSLTTDDEDLLAPLKIKLEADRRNIYYCWGSASALPYVIKEYALKPGKKFPLVKVDTPDGNRTNIATNKITVINWWSTGCAPCVEEIPGLNELVRKYENESVEFIAIVHDRENHAAFLKKYDFLYRQCFGDKNTEILFGKSFPRNLIVDKEGIIVYNKTGGSKDTYLEMDKVIKGLR